MIIIVPLCACLIGASWMIAFGLGILITYVEDITKERRKHGKHDK